MEEIVDPKIKVTPQLNEEYFNKSIKELNKATSYPITINIGRHLMNSYTQDYIEKTIRNSNFYEVHRRMDRGGRYEVLEINYRY